MTEQEYIAFVRDAVRQSFNNTHQGKPDDMHKYRTEGLIHAARLLGLMSADAVTEMIESEHVAIFGESVKDRKKRTSYFEKLKAESIDDYFDVPAIDRKR